MHVIVGFATEYPWRESQRCSEVSEGKRAEQRVGIGADKYLLTALLTDYFLFQEAVAENKNGFAQKGLDAAAVPPEYTGD